MKKIVKIKSVSDVITNSSSEVFVMKKADYYSQLENTNDCINCQKITWKWLNKHYKYEDELISHYIGKDFEINWYALDEIIEEQWKKFKEKNRDIIEEKLIGKYFVEIEDHFEDAYRVIDKAYSECEWSDSRH